MARIAFVGLGVMGAPMARHLAGAGHALIVHNRSPHKAEAWVAANGGEAAASVAEAAAEADAVIACVGNDRDVAEVAEAAFGAMRAGALFVDHTTVSARIARRHRARTRMSAACFASTPRSRAARPAPRTASSPSCAAAPTRRWRRRGR